MHVMCPKEDLVREVNQKPPAIHVYKVNVRTVSKYAHIVQSCKNMYTIENII